MCDHCEKQVISQGVLERDLPMLPYTLVKWRCLVPGCRGGCVERDYGMSPYYFDPVKRRRGKKTLNGGGWRGGWFDASEHFYICSRHSKSWERVVEMMRHRFTQEFFFSKIEPVKGNKK